MSTEKQKLNRIEVKVFVIRNHKDMKEFCMKQGINYGSFLTWLNGADTMPSIDRKIIDAAERIGYPVSLFYEGYQGQTA